MEAVIPDLTGIALRFRLRMIVRFGSSATGRATPDSDQDIGILASGRLDLESQADLVVALEEILGGREVDLAVLNGADPLLLFRVAREGIPLFESEPCEFLRFQSLAARRFHDTEKYRIAQREWLEARIA